MFRPVGSYSQIQPVIIAQKAVALRIGLDALARHSSKFSHVGSLGGILGGNFVRLGGDFMGTGGNGKAAKI